MGKNKRNQVKAIPESRIISKSIPDNMPRTVNLTPEQLIKMWKDKIAIVNSSHIDSMRDIENSMMNTVLDLFKKIKEQEEEINSLKKKVKN